jgi:hypothetical protein
LTRKQALKVFEGGPASEGIGVPKILNETKWIEA